MEAMRVEVCQHRDRRKIPQSPPLQWSKLSSPEAFLGSDGRIFTKSALSCWEVPLDVFCTSWLSRASVSPLLLLGIAGCSSTFHTY